MAHPYHMHREHQVSHRRVDPLLKDAGAGAMKSKSNAFSKVTSKTAAENHDRGYARGGKVKAGTTNIIIATGAKEQPAPPMPMAGPPGPPPGPPPGGPPPGMPLRARGGRLPKGGAESGVGRLQKARGAK